MKGKYNKGRTYCYKCDMDIVEMNRKCGVCGTRMKGEVKTPKKTTKEILDENEDK